MKDSIEIDGKVYDSVRAIITRFDVHQNTFHLWRRRYGFVAALKIGQKKYYDRAKIEAKIGDKLEVDESDHGRQE